MTILFNKANGKTYLDKEKLEMILVGLKNGKYKLEISPFGKTRTIKQNSYYWFYLTIISNETGDYVEDLHEYFKRKLLPPRFITILGNEIKLPATTTKLSKGDFCEYIMKIESLTGIPAPETELI